ncbi:MAG: nucleotidyltransferase family protein [candidate division KSB1 bacterium]|nr:nucleotidyltransferase family protein [candidate division KSB1 bacterium]
MNPALSMPREQIAAFCRKHGIRRLAIFGSALRGDFRPDSDVVVLVEFNPNRILTLFKIAAMERELSLIFSGRKADLRTPQDLSRYFRRQVMEDADVQYAEG